MRDTVDPSDPAAAPRRIRLLGGQVDAMTTNQLLDFIAARVATRASALIANHNLHSLHLWRRSPAMAALYARADRIEIDSAPLIAWGRLMGHEVSRAHRLTYLDWREAFWARAAGEGWRVFHLGCAPGVGEKAVVAITERHPRLKLSTLNGFFDVTGPENDAVLAAIREHEPDILLVGMGMPRQEIWIEANRERLPPCVVMPVGGALAYEAGAVATPPRWTGRLGVEWLWRFATEPRRLFHRYFVEPWALAPQAVGDIRRRLFRTA
ncbi:WecB/TagA/CpsF family glycosyltransferase [Brevundimonas sp.]|uniref:WecB/TagA/CpsF family glycosyltransferase n=1 Tax=Brevundimonas sp. TaxID=1871086 RepID=UPI00391B8284